MISFNSNAREILLGIADRLTDVSQGKEVLRDVAENMLPIVRHRIHVEGRDAEGAQIGEYTKGYMAVRTGLFKSNGVYAKGKNKGQPKPKGVFTKGKNKGAPRPNYNRSSDPTVILSLTRNMENDFSVQAEGERIGLGYNNEVNIEKVFWLESKYKRLIFALTPEEKTQAIEIANETVDKILKRNAA